MDSGICIIAVVAQSPGSRIYVANLTSLINFG